MSSLGVRGCVRASVRRPPPNLRKHTRVHAVSTPSNQTGSNVLQDLKQYTTVLLDSTLSPEKMTGDSTTDAAVVNFALMSHILANTSAFYEFANAIEKGVAKAAAETPGDKSAAISSAMTNVAVMLKDSVAGRIALEVDPRLSDDSDAMVTQAKSLAAMCGEQGLPADRILIQLPGTYAGIDAAAALQAGGLDCEIVGVYSVPQAALAVNKGAAVVVINVTHINLWYDRNPGAIRDPHGPRQDAGGAGDINMGVRTVATAYALAQRAGGDTRVIAMGLRTADEALALSGVDYMIVPDEVSAALAAQATLAGYNDGLSAAVGAGGGGGAAVPALDAAAVAAADVPDAAAAGSAAELQADMDMAGSELLARKVAADAEAAGRVEELLCSVVVARE
eukprot:jgi/Ulvmu1/4926/UM203_0005.1